jgi:hypothetical protein
VLLPPAGVCEPAGLWDPEGLWDPGGVWDPPGLCEPGGIWEPPGLCWEGVPEELWEPEGFWELDWLGELWLGELGLWELGLWELGLEELGDGMLGLGMLGVDGGCWLLLEAHPARKRAVDPARINALPAGNRRCSSDKKCNFIVGVFDLISTILILSRSPSQSAECKPL